MKNYLFALLIFFTATALAQTDTRIYDIIQKVSAKNIEADITTLANFGTRNTFSDTLSSTRGIGAARRWIKAEFQQISSNCTNCLEVFYQKDLVKAATSKRVPKDTWVVNVVAIQKSKTGSNRYIIISGDIDSRNSDGSDFTKDAPGANDNASGMAGAIEAARVLSSYEFDANIVYLGLSGEEQGLFGGAGFARYAQENNWDIIGVLNNDMIGNIKGVDGVISNVDFRIFSEPVPPTETQKQRRLRRFYGGEVDGISRQLARYVFKTTKTYMPQLNPMMIYRLDRFGRGGHHRPFNDLGYPAIRIMEAHENYNQQHQDIRTENGIEYGDKLTAVNAISMASLAWAPKAPTKVAIGGMVAPATKLRWEKTKNAVGYKIYWRDTTSPTWDYSRFVGDVDYYLLEGVVIDNYFFGVASVGKDGHESVVVFPSETFR